MGGPDILRLTARYTGAQEADGGSSQTFDDTKIAGAIRTDLTSSTEILVLAFVMIGAADLMMQTLALAAAGIAISARDYSIMAVIVKTDDIGAGLARRCTE